MKNIRELNLETIELDDQVLLVDKRIQPVNNWYFDTYIKKVNNTSGAEYAKDSQVIQIISSTKQIEGLPLLVIEDEVDKITKNEVPDRIYKSGVNYADNEQLGFKKGYNKAKETYKFTEEDLKRVLEFWGERGRYDKEGFTCSFEKWWEQTGKNSIESLTKKELWVEIENYCGSPYTTERCPKCVDSCDRAYQRPKITNGKIKSIWK